MTTSSKKVCLLGDFAVGKTSLVRRFVYNRFDERYLSTIGVNVRRKTIVLPRDSEIVELTMILWDLASGEEFAHMRASYLRGAAGAILVCDLTRPETMDSLRQYVADLLQASPACQSVILAVNKRDLTAEPDAHSRFLRPHQVEQLAAELNVPYFLTSAKTGETVEQAFRHLGQLLIG